MHKEQKNSSCLATRKPHFGYTLRLIWPLLLLALLSVAQAPVPVGQQPISNPISNTLDQNMQEPSREMGPNRDMGRMDPMLAKRQVQLLNVQRQKMMVSDADKLLKLATELKLEIDAGDSVSLSPEQLRKISEIEKLARSVKQKMSITIGGGPQVHDAFFP
jgi:hypothetical protein